MKKNLLTLSIFTVLCAVAAYFYFTPQSGRVKKELSDFAVKDTAAITKVFLADKKNNTALLERKSDGKWLVNGKYEARKDAIDILLETILKVTVRAPVAKSAFDNVVRNIAGDGIKVEIYQGGNKPVKVYYVGSANQDHSATFMLLENSSVPFLMHIEGFKGYLRPRYFTSENEWRNKKIFQYDYGDIDQVKVEHPNNPGQSFAIRDLGNNHFSLKSLHSGEEIADFDTTAVMKYLTNYKKVFFESFEETKTEAYIDSILQTPVHQIYTVTDKTGLTTKIQTYLKPAHKGAEDYEGNPLEYDMDRLYGLINDEDFVVIQFFVFDPLKWELDYFRKK